MYITQQGPPGDTGPSQAHSKKTRIRSPSPLISCRTFSRFLSSAMAFSICCREPSCPPFSSSAGPTALHKPGKDAAIAALGSWQSGLTATDGSGSRQSSGAAGQEGCSRIKGAKSGGAGSWQPAAGGRYRCAVAWRGSGERSRRVGLLREDTGSSSAVRSAGNTPHTSCNNTRLLKRQKQPGATEQHRRTGGSLPSAPKLQGESTVIVRATDHRR